MTNDKTPTLSITRKVDNPPYDIDGWESTITITTEQLPLSNGTINSRIDRRVTNSMMNRWSAIECKFELYGKYYTRSLRNRAIGIVAENGTKEQITARRKVLRIRKKVDGIVGSGKENEKLKEDGEEEKENGARVRCPIASLRSASGRSPSFSSFFSPAGKRSPLYMYLSFPQWMTSPRALCRSSKNRSILAQR